MHYRHGRKEQPAACRLEKTPGGCDLIKKPDKCKPEVMHSTVRERKGGGGEDLMNWKVGKQTQMQKMQKTRGHALHSRTWVHLHSPNQTWFNLKHIQHRPILTTYLKELVQMQTNSEHASEQVHGEDEDMRSQGKGGGGGHTDVYIPLPTRSIPTRPLLRCANLRHDVLRNGKS